MELKDESLAYQIHARAAHCHADRGFILGLIRGLGLAGERAVRGIFTYLINSAFSFSGWWPKHITS